MPDVPASQPADRDLAGDAPSKAGRTFARLMIFITAAFLVAVLGVLFYRWVTLTEPQFMLIVVGSPPWKGATVTVEGVTLNEPFVRTIGEGSGWKLPFYLDRGTYKVQIDRDGHMLLQSEVLLATGSGVQLDLSKHEDLARQFPATAATAPSDDEPDAD